MKRPGARILAAALMLAFAGCRGGEEPVAELAVEGLQLTLAYPAETTLETTWRLLAPLSGEGREAVVFVHLVDATGEVVRTFDQPFPARWQPGLELAVPLRLWQSALAPPLPAGGYFLTLGLYEPGSGERWPLAVAGEEVGRHEYRLGRVEVPPRPAEGEPEVAFSGGWLAPEPSGDRQQLAHRWLGPESGGIAFTGLDGPQLLALEVSLPDLEGRGWRLLLAEGQGLPRLTVTSDCGGEATVEGYGRHLIDLRLDPLPADGACSLRFDPGFVLLEEQTFTRRTVILERLSWSPAAPATGR